MAEKIVQTAGRKPLEKVQTSDALVAATPTYFLTMNGMLKTTIDRFLPKWQDSVYKQI